MYRNIGLRAEYLNIRQLKAIKLHPQNRNINKKNVANIYAAMERGEAINPIIVNRRTNILIDGQHRREAQIMYWENHKDERKELVFEVVSIDIPANEEFAYIVCSNSKPIQWKAADYLNAFAEAGNENYIRLRKFMKDCDLCHTATEDMTTDRITSPKVTYAVSLLGNKAYHTLKFKTGQMKVTDEDIKKAMVRAEQVKRVLKAIDPDKTVGLRSVNYLILSWIGRDEVDELDAESRVSYIEASQERLRKWVYKTGNKLSKSSDWNNLFNQITVEISATKPRNYSKKLRA